MVIWIEVYMRDGVGYVDLGGIMRWSEFDVSEDVGYTAVKCGGGRVLGFATS
jgi:hypothetical protein